MSDIQQQAQAIEISVENAKNSAAVSDAIKRLRKNRDFKKVVLEGYFEKEALRLVHASTEPAMERDQTTRDIEAIATFREFLDNLEKTGDAKREALEDLHAEQDELNAELAEEQEG